MHRKFDFLLHNNPWHSYFRSCLEEELTDSKRTTGSVGNSEDHPKCTEKPVPTSSTSSAVSSLGSPITAATLAEVKPPKGVVLPDDQTVLAMLAKLLEFRRTFDGPSWTGFLQQLQRQEAARPGPSRFSFLSPESIYHDFWVWAVKGATSAA